MEIPSTDRNISATVKPGTPVEVSNPPTQNSPDTGRDLSVQQKLINTGLINTIGKGNGSGSQKLGTYLDTPKLASKQVTPQLNEEVVPPRKEVEGASEDMSLLPLEGGTSESPPGDGSADIPHDQVATPMQGVHSCNKFVVLKNLDD